MSQRPVEGEYAPYFEKYIAQAKGDLITTTIQSSQEELLAYLQNLPVEKWDYKYGPDKWTIKEVMLHIIDTERIFMYRALRVGRHDTTPLKGFEQDDYVPYCNVDQRSPESIIAEYQSVRAASLSLFQHFREEDLKVIGNASEKPISCRALGFMIAGHEQHHLRILKERY